MIEIKKIDAHSHFGGSFLGPESTIRGYVLEARRLGIIATIASPGPAPEIIENGKMVRPCLWEVDDGKVKYFRQEIDLSSGMDKKRDSDVNPYHEVNLGLIEEAREYNQENNGHKILIMPIHHPILDYPQEVKSLLSLEDTIALKIHGIATFTGPQDIPQSTVDVLKKFDKPLIVHTDMYRGEIKSNIHAAYQLNDPVLWAEWGKETGIKTLITHGARLSPQAIELVKSTPNLMIGLSPDLLLMDEPERLHHDTDNFLVELLATVPAEKLLFDIDYGWNVSERNRWDKQDWRMCERIDSAANRAGLIQTDLDKIYFDNATRFYNI